MDFFMVIFANEILDFFKTSAGQLIIILLVILLILFIGFRIVRYISRRLRSAWNRLENSSVNKAYEMMKAAAEKQSVQPEESPRSLNGMESIYAPKIAKDFPDLRIDMLGAQAEELLRASYKVLNKGITKEFSEKVGPYYNANMARILEQRKNLSVHAARFSDVKIHRRVLSDYGYRDGKRSIDFQFAVEAMVSSDANSTPIKKQMRNSIRYQYTDDIQKFENEKGEKTLRARNCPNCGAPLASSDTQNCQYCGTNVRQLSLSTWMATDVFPEYWVEGWNI